MEEEALRAEYEALLRTESRTLRRPSEKEVAALWRALTAEERRFFGGTPLLSGEAGAADPFRGILPTSNRP